MPAGAVEAVPASQVRRDDRVLVRAGDTIPVDGDVLTGRSNVDQKTITGESVAVLESLAIRSTPARSTAMEPLRSRRRARWATR